MADTVLKWTIPIGIRAYIGPGPVAHVDADPRGAVNVWTIERVGDTPGATRTAIAVATGRIIPDGMTHIGTAVDRGLWLVWHVFAEDDQ